MCYKRLVMIHPPATAAALPRQRPSRTLAPALLAALTTLALVGCAASTSVGPPRFSTDVDDQTFRAGRTILSPVVLPAAVGGIGALTYSLSPDVPGLTFDADTRTLSGTPTTADTYAMTYSATDNEDRTARLHFTITIDPYSAVRALVSEITAGRSSGVPRLEDVPEPNGGPAVSVSGSEAFVAGGAVFLNVRPVGGGAIDKLLVSIGGESFGYYEVDLQDTASSYRLVGHIPFDLDPAMLEGCVAVSAVDTSGAVGAPDCHPMYSIPVNFADVQVTVSWDSAADLDLHVADPAGAEVYYGRPRVASGGAMDLAANADCELNTPQDGRSNEHITWALGPPPAGIYEVRVSHWKSCGAHATSYVVSIYNHGRTSTFSGSFTGPGDDDDGRGIGRVITLFQVGDDPAPERAPRLSSSYRGSGDQVFVLNPNGEVLDDTLYTLDLGNALAEVYVVGTASNYHVDPQIERLDLREAVAKGRRAAVQEQYEPAPRPSASEAALERSWITDFNNGPPLTSTTVAQIQPPRVQPQRTAASEGDTFTFTDENEAGDFVDVPATARRVVADGPNTLTVWVADREWGAGCVIAEQCVTQEMVDALADRFLRPGGDDIYDSLTAIFGDPWGPHDLPFLIPPEDNGNFHILLFDIEEDGIPSPGEGRIAGYFFSLHYYLHDPEDPDTLASAERLIFFVDSPLFADQEGPTWEVTDLRPSDLISTVAHEFQHMIHFYQKRILHGTRSEAWLNEMASEVAEDLIADKMMVNGPRAVAYDDPTAGEFPIARSRLPKYNLFNDIQVTRWNSSIANYAINYALGAYLARTYGGAELFSHIVQSDRAGVDAIEAALDALGHDVSFAEVMANWAAANLLSDNTEAPVPYRYNPGTWTTSHAGGQEFRLGSINLYNYVFVPGGLPNPDFIGPDYALRLAHRGPYLHSLRGFNARTQPPHSNMYTTLGRNSGSLRLSVTADTQNIITVVVKE